MKRDDPIVFFDLLRAAFADGLPAEFFPLDRHKIRCEINFGYDKSVRGYGPSATTALQAALGRACKREDVDTDNIHAALAALTPQGSDAQ